MLVCPKCYYNKFKAEVVVKKILAEAAASRTAIRGIVESSSTEVRYFCGSCGAEVIPVNIPAEICEECGEVFAGTHQCKI